MANEDTGGEKYRLQREECPEQREREWIKRAIWEYPAEGNPAHHGPALQHNELRSARKRSDCMKNTMMKSDLFLILLFGGGGFYVGGPYVGGGLGTILVIVLIVILIRGV